MYFNGVHPVVSQK